MPIPALNEHGLLPEGIHDCTLGELRTRFGEFQSSDRRSVLYHRLEQFVTELRRGKVARELIVDGSFVTTKPDPNDIDLVLVLPVDHDAAADLTPDLYNLLSKRRVRMRFGFDIFVVREQSLRYDEAVAAMIENDEQLEVTYQQLGRMYRALAELRREVRPVNPRKCNVFAEGFVDQIRSLQREIDAYLGLDQSVQAEVQTASSEPVDMMRETPPPYTSPEDS